ncbi:hypothetical protein A0J61_04344 [Choanephora cucurbitarum]|uniref:Uncharacterized protein n=1 Tax=Choanephora cucurbitarum TaxID=101091 RepID=A0A1C7NGC4_9FUNG|nr:hypothetical protein A0J61_04344 [Choanephora cucurbitarum]
MLLEEKSFSKILTTSAYLLLLVLSPIELASLLNSLLYANDFAPYSFMLYDAKPSDTLSRPQLSYRFTFCNPSNIPFSAGGYIDLLELVENNTTKALRVMNQLTTIGLIPPPSGFYPPLSSRFYAHIIRQQLEYGLSLSLSVCLSNDRLSFQLARTGPRQLSTLFYGGYASPYKTSHNIIYCLIFASFPAHLIGTVSHVADNRDGVNHSLTLPPINLYAVLLLKATQILISLAAHRYTSNLYSIYQWHMESAVVIFFSAIPEYHLDDLRSVTSTHPAHSLCFMPSIA